MSDKDIYRTIVIKEILGPCLLLFGVSSNFMAIKILNTKTMKNYPTTDCMKIISIVDIILVILFSSQAILEVYFLVDIRLLHSFGCKLVTFSLYFLSQLSINLFAMMSVDKLLRIMKNSITGTSKNKTVNKRLFIALICVLVALNFHFVIFMDLYPIKLIQNSPDDVKSLFDFNYTSLTNLKNEHEYNLWICFARENTAYFKFVNFTLPLLDTFSGGLLPMGAMILSAIFIFNKIKQNANKRPNLKSYNSIVRTRKRKNIEYLNILISAILTYILTFIPIMIMNYVSLDHSFCCNSSLMTLADFILYIKYCVNPIFYAKYNKGFRNELYSLLKEKKKHLFKISESRIREEDNATLELDITTYETRV